LDVKQLIQEVKNSAIEVYRELGAGYNEEIYEEAIAVEFRQRRIPYEVERNTEIFYKGSKVGIHRLDFILERKLVVELKAQAGLTKSHIGQTRAYLNTLKKTDAILVNFPYPERDEPDFMEVNL